MNYMDVETLKHKLKVLHVLDQAIKPDEPDEYMRFIRYSRNEAYEQYVIDNGAGDKLMVRFFEIGVFVKGFDHENELNQWAADEWDDDFFTRMFAGAPGAFVGSLTEEEHDCTTFCMWYLSETGEWYQNEVIGNNGGKSFLMGYLPESPEELTDWAEDYYGKSLNEAVIKKLFETAELSEEDKKELIK